MQLPEGTSRTDFGLEFIEIDHLFPEFPLLPESLEQEFLHIIYGHFGYCTEQPFDLKLRISSYQSKNFPKSPTKQRTHLLHTQDAKTITVGIYYDRFIVRSFLKTESIGASYGPGERDREAIFKPDGRKLNLFRLYFFSDLLLIHSRTVVSHPFSVLREVGMKRTIALPLATPARSPE